jgi:hypothetical protein
MAIPCSLGNPQWAESLWRAQVLLDVSLQPPKYVFMLVLIAANMIYETYSMHGAVEMTGRVCNNIADASMRARAKDH